MGKVLVVVTLGRRFCVIAEQDLLFVKRKAVSEETALEKEQ